MFFAGALGTGAGLYFMNKEEAECASFSDKVLDATMDKINAGVEEVISKNPGMQKVKISSGLRGVRYFIEFPIVGHNVDAFSLLSSTQQKLDSGKKDKNYMVKVIGNDSYINEENVAYLIDYAVRSKSVGGTNNKGSIYIRGIKGNDGLDSFKFILEKANDFSDFDAELMINAYEQAMKPRSGGLSVESFKDDPNLTPA